MGPISKLAGRMRAHFEERKKGRTILRIAVGVLLLGVISLFVVDLLIEKPWAWRSVTDHQKFQVLAVQDQDGIVGQDFTPVRFAVLDKLTPLVSFRGLISNEKIILSTWRSIPGPRPLHHSYRVSERNVLVWLRLRSNGHALPPWTQCWLTMPDGQRFRSWVELCDNNGRDSMMSIEMYFVPRTLKILSLHLESESGGKPYLLEIPNPRFSTELHRWTPSRLPQTKTVGNLQITLKSLSSRYVPMPAPNDTTWLTDAHFDVVPLNGDNTSNYDFWTVFEDEDGHRSSGRSILSQPTCRVVLEISPRRGSAEKERLPAMAAEFLAKPPLPPEE